VTAFSANRRLKSGLRSACRECNAAYDSEPRSLERKIERNRRYRAKPEGRLANLRHSVRWQDANPEKLAAQYAVRNAKDRGDLKPQPCRDCGSKRVHGHHHDYSKPLDVIWLCPRHHREEHARLRDGSPG